MTTVLSWKIRRARTPKRCWLCRDPIERGWTYRDVRCAGEGSVWPVHYHIGCLDLVERVDPRVWDDDGVWEGHLLEVLSQVYGVDWRHLRRRWRAFARAARVNLNAAAQAGAVL